MFSYAYRHALAMAARNPGNAALQANLLKLTTSSSAHDAVFGSLNNSVVLGQS
jgi:hypothetical protein